MQNDTAFVRNRLTHLCDLAGGGDVYPDIRAREGLVL